MINLRYVYAAGLLITISVLCSAFYIEDYYMVAPCPLCTLQRIVYAGLGGLFLIALLWNPRKLAFYLYNGLIILWSLIGFGIAWRQFWLQYFATKEGLSCAASLERLISAYPILDALKVALKGSTECAKVDFTIFGISLAGWSILLFGYTVIILAYIMLQKKKADF